MNALEFVSGLALRYLRSGQVDAVRGAYRSLRTKLEPAMAAMYGTFDTAALRADLESRVGNDFELLMVHSSINHMMPMYRGNALELVRMLVDWCGPRRTLVMPAFYFGEPGQGGAFNTFVASPRFDLRRTPSQMGLATELFRRMPGVVLSRHPVYRVAALGPLARELVAGHELADYPAGLGTPFEFMARRNTLIVGIGKPMQVMTQAHHVEGVLREDFPVRCVTGESLSMTLLDGAHEVPFTLVRRSYEGRFDMWRLRRVMDRSQLREWSFHHVPMFAARAPEVTQALVDAARRGFTLYAPR